MTAFDLPPTRAKGPWLLPIGMHRSGTSAVTGALAELGFRPPSVDDRVEWADSNPEHWESRSITLFDDALLEQFGGAWDAPPDLEQGWTDKITAADQANAPQLLTAAFDGSGPFVWKDPRVSLLLPFWKPLLEPPLAAVLIWRDPMAVAESLQRRDDIDRPVGLALWERYNRAALDGLVGVDTYVIQYEDLLKDPEGSLESMADWLDSLPGFAGRASTATTRQAAATLHAGTSTPFHGNEFILQKEQVRLEGVLRRLHGGHRPLENFDSGPESPWSSALLRSRTFYRSREMDRQVAWTAYWKRTAQGMEASTSWRSTRWLRALSSKRSKQ